ncbi:pectinesterase family protein, partial [Genlisea aurea]
IAVTGVASVLLVAMVVAVAVGVNRGGSGGTSDSPGSSGSGSGGGVSSTTKSVQAICSPTDYKQTCEESLAGANSTDPKYLIKLAFQNTVKGIRSAILNSTLYREAAADPNTKGALQVCEEVLDNSVDDLQRSFDQVEAFDVNRMDEYIDDIKTWLSGAIANKEACIDAVNGTSGDTAEKMKKLLNTTSEMLSNGLAIVTDFSTIFSSLQLGSFTSRRRLMGEGEENPDDGFVQSARRRLLAVNINTIKANVTVAQDGSGQFKTIGAALATLPKKSNDTFVIHVKAGVYKETVIVPKKVNNVVIYGDGPEKTRVVNNKNYADGVQTFHTATLAVNSDGFMAKDIAFENSAGPTKHQAVAVRVSGDKAVFYNVVMDGYQDTLYAHGYRQFYRNCTISGTIDFVFGDATAVFQKCRFIVRKPDINQNCMVTAQGRKDSRSIGVTVIQNSEIVPEAGFTAVKPKIDAFLGRPWKEYSRTLIMNTFIDGFIDPAGWSPWMGNYGLNTLYYGEYQNKGPGADTSKRVTWKGIQKITPEIALSFTAQKVYLNDGWVTNSSVPYTPGL